MAAEDRQENDLPLSEYIKYVRGISNNNESVNFDIGNMFKLFFRGIIGGVIETHPNELKHGLYYKNRIDNTAIEQLYPLQDAFIIVLYIGDGVLQIHIHPINGGISLVSLKISKFNKLSCLLTVI